MAGIIGNSVRKCVQGTPHQGHHWYEHRMDLSWDASADIGPSLGRTVGHYCPGVQRPHPFEQPGYVVEIWISPDQGVEGAPEGGKAFTYRQRLPAEALQFDYTKGPQGLQVQVGTVGGLVADMAAHAFNLYVEKIHEERSAETGLRPMTPEESYRALRRRRDVQHSPMGEALARFDGEYSAAPDPRTEYAAPGEREVWQTGMVPANPAVCQFCRRRIVFAYPQWVRDDDAPGHDPSICERSTHLGRYHQPEADDG